MDGGCFQTFNIIYSYVFTYERVLFFELRYCVVKYANISYSCCKESSRPEFENSRQRQLCHVGINIILRTSRINTRKRFFCNTIRSGLRHGGNKQSYTRFAWAGGTFFLVVLLCCVVSVFGCGGKCGNSLYNIFRRR